MPVLDLEIRGESSRQMRKALDGPRGVPHCFGNAPTGMCGVSARRTAVDSTLNWTQLGTGDGTNIVARFRR